MKIFLHCFSILFQKQTFSQFQKRGIRLLFKWRFSNNLYPETILGAAFTQILRAKRPNTFSFFFFFPNKTLLDNWILNQKRSSSQSVTRASCTNSPFSHSPSRSISYTLMASWVLSGRTSLAGSVCLLWIPGDTA